MTSLTTNDDVVILQLMTWLLFLATVVASVVVGSVDDDVVDYVLDDVGTDVVVVGASMILVGEDDDVVAFVSTVVVYDVDGGVVSAVEVGGVVDATVDDNVELFNHTWAQACHSD